MGVPLLGRPADAQAIFVARQRLGEDMIGYAHAVKIDALAGLGKLLEQTPLRAGSRGVGNSGVPKVNPTSPTLAEMGIDKKTSSLLDLDARRPRGVQPAVEPCIEL